MIPAKKQVAKKIVSSFLGNEAENEKVLAKKKLIRYSPDVEFYTNIYTECLVVVVRHGDEPKDNPVYRVTDVKLIPILEAYAALTNGITFYYKVPLF